MRSPRSLILGGVSLLFLPAVLAAQHPQTRDGFWIGFGIGWGSADATCDGCADTDRLSSFTSFIKLGGTLNDRVLLGGEITGWTKSESGVTETLGNMTATAYFYPNAAGGFFLKGGAGFSVYAASNGGSVSGTGVGLTVGLGYDIRVGGNLSLTPVADFLFGSVGDISENGTALAQGWKQNVFSLGLGVTFH